MAIGYLNETVKDHGFGSIHENLRLHHTKYSMLIMNVISPYLEESLEENG